MPAHSARPSAVAARLAPAAALAGLSVLLQGCETDFERRLRKSCHWNPDIQLKGCDRWGFKECIDNCEYCFGDIFTTWEARGDDCAQLKCGAYCAKQLGGECQSTYSILCKGGLEELAASAVTCDVDCSRTAAPYSPVLAVFLAVLAALWHVQHSWLAVLPLLAAAALLQGCTSCPLAEPSLADWQVDLKRLDERAGCKDEWNWKWGNPCASDVPVVFAKKSLELDADEDFVKGRVENEVYECVERAAGGRCHKWTAFEVSCREQKFGECTCKQPSDNSKYCYAWQCVSKKASQNLCEENCCGQDCTPCVLCGDPRSSEYPMSLARYNEIVAADGTSAATHGDWFQALSVLRKTYWLNFDYGGECVAPRVMKSPAESSCRRWREIETEVTSCECHKPGTSSDDYCEAWTCARMDAGPFSILFAKSMSSMSNVSYDSLVQNTESEEYVCIETTLLASGASRCQAWRGEITRYKEVKVAHCRATCSDSGCNEWRCNEYELPRIQDVDDWWKRLFFYHLHFLWMWLPLLLILRGRIKDARNLLGLCPCGMVFACSLIWAVGFLRYRFDEARWRAPVRPFLGLLLMLGPAWVLAALIWLFGSQERVAGVSPLVLVLPVMMLSALAWTNGMVVVIIASVVLALMFLVAWSRRRKKV